MTQFWKKVREAVQGAAEDGAEALKEGAAAVADRAPKMASAVAGKSRDALRIADLRIQIHRLNIQAEQLFNLFDAGSGSVVIGGTTWSIISGLTGSPGRVNDLGGGSFDLLLSGNGDGLRGDSVVIPEPITMLTLALSVTGLGGYIRRRR